MKNSLRSFLLTCLIALTALSGFGQDVPKFEGSDPLTPEASFSMTVSKYAKDLCVGDVVTVCFTGKVHSPGWHLYSSSTEGNISYNATELYFYPEESKGAELSGKMTENKKPREYEDELMGGTIRDFKEKEVKFFQKIKITSEDVSIEGELSAQTCVDPDQGGMCKFLKLPFSWKFKAKSCEEEAAVTPEPKDDPTKEVEGATEEAPEVGGTDGNEAATPDSAAKEALVTDVKEGGSDGAALGTTAAPGAANGATIEEPEAGCDSSTIWRTFFIAFLAGLAALLTPCVFPMIPLTVSYFVKQNEGGGERAKGIRNALLYSASIILIYGGLGLIIPLVFGPGAMYFISSHPIPNLVFFAIFLLFALSFLGMFDLTLPSSWSSKLSNKAGTGGFIGIFFMALVLVVVSFSCTGPILGGLIVGTTQANCLWAPAAGLFGFGFAFGIPFGIFAMFPSLLSSLPQSGGWLNAVKVVFGFLELAACMKFLSNADLAWHLHLLDRQIFIGIWIVIFFLLGVYLLGKLQLPHDDKVERVPVPRFLLAVASFSFAVYMVPGLWGGPLSALEGLVPPMNKSIGVKLLPHQRVAGGGGHGGAMNINAEICKQDRKYGELFEDREAHGFCMFYDLEQALAFAKEKNKPLFVDFTGHSCANCRKMENDVWPVDKVMTALSEEYVMVSLYADETYRFEKPLISPDGKKLRTIGDWVVDYQGRNFKTVSQPYYVLMGLNEEALSKPRGYAQSSDPNEFHAFLMDGVEKFQEKYGK